MQTSHQRHRSYTTALAPLLAPPDILRNKLIVTAENGVSDVVRRAAIAGARGIGCDLLCVEFDLAAR